jgi:hypothetical protein
MTTQSPTPAPLRPKALSAIRRSLVMGPEGPPGRLVLKIRWQALIHDRKARAARDRAALMSLPGGDAA